MNKEILKQLFMLKLQLIDGMKEHLPPDSRGKLDSLQRDFMESICEVVGEYLGQKKEEGHSGIKPVNIE